eukprot:TRINITY_DN2107_c0_g1_i3.p1 TRINITY_DN2107_c0_g1~~TRINITY_DN2107_c0_g1_i3.p1  ORF type:complete len:484 (+),score=163.05 TRINITY_DN2107_c0_g1_i3:1242-2693(+)
MAGMDGPAAGGGGGPRADELEVKWKEVQDLVDKRQMLRVEKQYKEADAVFDRLTAMHVAVDDETKKWTHKGSGASGDYSPVDWAAVKVSTLRRTARLPPSHQQSPLDWTCEKCGNINWARRSQCNRCNHPRPAGPEGVVLNKRESIRRENQQERDEMKACDKAFLQAKAEREAREAELSAADALHRQAELDYASAHPLPEIPAAATPAPRPSAGSGAAKAKPVSAPPQPKAGRDLSGVAKLKRAREEMLAEKERRAKAQKTAADATPHAAPSNGAKAPSTLGEMSLAIGGADDRLQLLKNVRMVAKVVGTKTEAVRRMGQLGALFTEVARWQTHAALKGFRDKEAAVLREACCDVVKGLVTVTAEAADREDAQRAAALWLMNTTAPAGSAASVAVGPTVVPLLLSFLAKPTPDGAKAKALACLAPLAALCLCPGLAGRKLREHLVAMGVWGAVARAKVADPSPAVMDALRPAAKALQDAGLCS